MEPVLTRAIDWILIRQQYDQMVKYATALRLGIAETESILRRFTRSNLQHPTYKALAELDELREAVDRVKAYQDFQPDKFDRRELNRRLRTLTQDREVRR